ncbi:MAG: ribonuclease R [Metamycoplasmataceae bacterium]
MLLNINDLKEFINEKNEVSFIEIAKEFRISINQNRELTLFLNSLIKDGIIMQNTKKNFFVPTIINKIITKIKINPKGFGFVDINEREAAFISSNNIHGAMDEDEVEVIIMNDTIKPGSFIGSVVRVVKRKNEYLYGTIEKNGQYFDFIPLIQKIRNRFRFVNKEMLKDKMFVKAKIEDINSEHILLRIVKNISDINKPYADINLLLESMEVDDTFNSKVLEEASKVPTVVQNISEFGRVDLRDKLIVTIDGESTKDFDDAITVKKLDNGNYFLGVYIADVAYYVKEDSEIDKQAFSRGTSIYLIDKVIPMLPEVLSNGICSLNPNVDRFVLALEVEIDNFGKAINPRLFPALINSKHRLTYNQVADYQTNEYILKDNELVNMLKESYELSNILSIKKNKEGYIDFEIEEPIIQLDENGKTKNIISKSRKSSEILIENFMVFANETVSKIVSDLKVPNIYRIHEKPSDEKIMMFQSMLNILGVKITLPHSGSPIEFSKAINSIKDVRFDDLIKLSLLRTMQKAKYESNNIGHFGLASEYYSHFTSPIRRYPDLILHRIIWEVMIKKNKDYAKEMVNKIDLICSQSSKQEELAVSIERKIYDVKKAEFYESKIGKILEGMIVSVKKFGLFIDFPDKVCGFVHVSNIPDGPYNMSNNGLQLYNERKTYTIGDTVFVKITTISKLEGKVDGVIINK